MVPDLAPDELAGSFLATVARLNAFTDPRQMMEWYAGSGSVKLCMDLPSRLNVLQQRLGRFSPCRSGDEWMDRATLFPYFGAFLNPGAREAARAQLLDGPGTGLRMSMGLLANRFGATVALRYCPACLREDLHLQCRSYWHRVHQLPGVIACARHAIGLVASERPLVGAYQFRLALPPADVLSAERGFRPDATMLRIATLSQDLLCAGLPEASPERRSAVYRHAIMDIGLAGPRGRIDYPALAHEVRGHFNDFAGFSHRERLLSSACTPLAWLRTVVERPQRSSHPLCHLLLIDYVFGGLAAFRGKLGASPPVHVGPSHLIAHDKTPPTALDDGSPLLDAALSSREAALRLHVNVHTVMKRRRALGLAVARRPKRVTEPLRERVLTLLEQGTPCREVAKQCTLSLSTVYRLKDELPNASFGATPRRDHEVARHRAAWDGLVRTHGKKGVSVARAAGPAIYGWLYRNDREWLMAINSGHGLAVARGRRVDWAAEDQRLSEVIRSRAGTLLTIAPRAWISYTALVAADVSKLRRHADKLPVATATVQQLAQNRAAFRASRVIAAKAELTREQLPLKAWRIRERSGLRSIPPELTSKYAAPSSPNRSRLRDRKANGSAPSAA